MLFYCLNLDLLLDLVEKLGRLQILDNVVDWNKVKSVTASSDGSRGEYLEEHLAFFNGEDTHSCIYLFNPRTKQEIENDLKLVNITQRQSSTFI